MEIPKNKDSGKKTGNRRSWEKKAPFAKVNGRLNEKKESYNFGRCTFCKNVHKWVVQYLEPSAIGVKKKSFCKSL